PPARPLPDRFVGAGRIPCARSDRPGTRPANRGRRDPSRRSDMMSSSEDGSDLVPGDAAARRGRETTRMQTIPSRTFEEADTLANLQHPDSWSLIPSHRLSTQAVAGETLAEIAETRPEIAVVTADLKYSNRLSDFAARHPAKFYQVGIAEQNM